jgi:hypothetical protein
MAGRNKLLVCLMPVVIFAACSRDGRPPAGLKEPEVVAIGYGAKWTTSGGGISHISIENLESRDHTGAGVRVTFMVVGRKLPEREFYIGELAAGDEWAYELDSPVRDVGRIEFRYFCREGLHRGSVDVDQGDEGGRLFESIGARVRTPYL